MKNEALSHHRKYEGTYEKSESVNDKPSWKSQSAAIWYLQGHNIWVIGDLSNIGEPLGFFFFTQGMLLGANGNGKWKYFNRGIWKNLDTTDFSIECIARKGTND